MVAERPPQRSRGADCSLLSFHVAAWRLHPLGPRGSTSSSCCYSWRLDPRPSL